MAKKPSIPKGTRDFNPEEVAKRNYIFNTIRQNFERFGFQPIETPSFENSETLMGKYGDEGDRLIFKILNSGDFLSKADEQAYSNKDSNKITPSISEKALRYDLTVPFARYVVQHQNDIEFPFKRYQIQPVWRADRPQKGRFREFFQCDADVVGSQSLWQEDKLIDFTVALDKLDKIGEEKVKEEMLGKGISQAGIDKLQPLFNLSGTFESQIAQLKTILSTSEQGTKGIEELEFIDTAISELKLESASLQLDVTLARGLNYYTGAIFEVSAPKGVDMGSIGGGGRYDDLTGIFGLKDVSGVGISFGLDRIYLVLEDLKLFPETITNTVQALFINFGEAEAMASMKAIKELRKHGINAELFPDNKKTVRQFNYANKRNIPNVVLVGESELTSDTYTLKNMASGDQQSLDLEALVRVLGIS